MIPRFIFILIVIILVVMGCEELLFAEARVEDWGILIFFVAAVRLTVFAVVFFGFLYLVALIYVFFFGENDSKE